MIEGVAAINRTLYIGQSRYTGKAVNRTDTQPSMKINYIDGDVKYQTYSVAMA
jgi:hypothetical protein